MESQTLNDPPMPGRATMQDIQALLNGEALNHLAPVPGGRWQMLSRVDNIILVAYVLEDGTQVMTTTVNVAFDAQTAAGLCWQHIYNFPAGAYNPGLIWEDESSQAQPAIISNAQMATSAPMNQQPNNTWTAGPTSAQPGGAPILANPQLPAPYQPINTVQGQQHPHNQAQALAAPDSGGMDLFQVTQPVDMSGDPPGDLSAYSVAAFQGGSETVFDAGQFVDQNGQIQNMHQWQPFP
ncbi:mating type MAT1-2-3 [Fusarium agapanthi]|uniref:Mating type MAT1-2-3 n=1 Tax=Fusarium agapanthi TaxID=1803897 RepID=A0A5J6YI65_9HYPO|nr:mating type MAT1-2-3 [Fusarium agapanthi]QFP39830.1 mating type protein 1-2-9 [Fusarium agapanthi]